MTLSTVDVAEIEATTELATGTSTVPNPKFKTSLCRNFLNATCNRQTGCHFAHGSEELRAVSENSGFYEEVDKPTADYLIKWPTNIPTNYKTTLCKFYEQVGTCRYDQNCNFAHGDQEKRAISETIASQLKSSRNQNKHINNSAGQKGHQQIAMQQYMMSTQMQQYMAQLVIGQQLTFIVDLCKRLSADSSDEYVEKTVSDVKKLADQFKFKPALQQLKKLCSGKDATTKQQEMLKEIEAGIKYIQAASAAATQETPAPTKAN